MANVSYDATPNYKRTDAYKTIKDYKNHNTTTEIIRDYKYHKITTKIVGDYKNKKIIADCRKTKQFDS